MAESTDLTVPVDAPPVKLVEARWVGPCESELVDKTILVPGVTVVEIPEPEAIDSDNWQIVSGVTVADLRKTAKDLGIEVPKGAKKADIESLIAAAHAGGDDGDAVVESDTGEAED